MPLEHYIGILCEEFHCRPSQIWEERLVLPEGTLEQIIEYRRFAETYWRYRRQQNPKEESEMLQLVKLIETERAAERMGITFIP